MIINHNMMAMNTHRQMGINQGNSGKAIEKLSSGLRINRAGDDAAGLAISEKMRGQIRGLNQASRNSQDAISMIQTAEGALNETHAILQRMRELSVQASTDTNTAADRGEIQKEVNQLTSEINRIGNTTEFNTMNLLDGSRSDVSGTGTYKITADAKTYSVVSGVGVDTSGITGEIPTFSSADGVNTIDFSAVGAGGFDWTDVDSTATNSITIAKNGSDLNITIDAEDNAGATLDVADMQAELVDGDYVFNNHGVEFSISQEDFDAMNDGDSFVIDLAAVADPSATATNVDLTAKTVGTVNSWTTNVDDGTNGISDAAIATGIVIGSDAMEGAASIQIQGATLDTDGTAQIDVTISDKDGNALSTDTYVFDTAADTQNWTYDEHGISFTLTHTDAVTLDMTQDLDTTSTELTQDESLTFQVGANESQSMSLGINDMRADALGISSTTAGAGFSAAMSVTDGTDNTAAEYALNVSTVEDASQAITTIQSAIDKVSSERSKLGAVQNRLEHTIKNLDTSSENLQASESRIRDVDMAKEMMNFQKNNILQQAAQSMLAQANQQPQGVLSLLR